MRTDSQWWAIIVALLLGISGIFQDRIKRFFFKPKLNIYIKPYPPDSHKIQMRNPQTGQFICDSYYFRFRVENTGNEQLNDAEAIIAEVYKKEANGECKKLENFSPLNLVWLYSHNIVMPKIQPKLFKHLDFGHILKSEFANLNFFGLTENSKIVFLFDLAWKSDDGSHILFPGEYKITIKFAANNLSPITKNYHLVVADKWDDNEQKMMRENISIKEIN